MRVRKDIDIVMEPGFGRYYSGEMSWKAMRFRSLLERINDPMRRYSRKYLASLWLWEIRRWENRR